ncbi:MAG: fatty acyl-AMP ligase, partial [Gammaproteobacteria bacterium]
MHKNTLIDCLLKHLLDLGQDTAFIYLADGKIEKDTLTYAELDTKARAIASYLQQYAKPGDCILLSYLPGLDFVTAFVGCLYAGMIAVPAFPMRNNHHAQRLWLIMKDCGSSLVCGTKSSLTLMRHQPEFANYIYLETDNITSDAALHLQPYAAASEQIALLQYTSGSTGEPKGVMVSHGNIIHNMSCLNTAFGFDKAENKITAFWIPVQHDMSLMGEILITLYIGGTGVMLSPTSFIERPLNWLKAIQKYHAYYAAAPNFAYDLCVEKISAEEKHALDLRGWQVAMNASEPVRWKTLEKFCAAFEPCGFQAKYFMPAYGLAEVTLLVSGTPLQVKPVKCNVDKSAYEKGEFRVVDNNASNRIILASSGKILWAKPKHEIQIVDPETHTLCSEPQMGEIWIKSASVAQGYWQKPEATEATFSAYLADGRGPYLRTGDLGVLHAGELYITGRIKDIIIIQGRNLYPQDIEAAVESCHSSLRLDCTAAFSIEQDGEERLVIVAEIKRTARKQDTSSIFAAIRKAVIEAVEIVPYSIQLLQPAQALKTTSGKIQRQATKRAYLAGQLKTLAQEEETVVISDYPHLEEDLYSIYQHILEIKDIKSDDKFSTLG